MQVRQGLSEMRHDQALDAVLSFQAKHTALEARYQQVCVYVYVRVHGFGSGAWSEVRQDEFTDYVNQSECGCGCALCCERGREALYCEL
jgi:hypothetical protein